MGAYRIMGFTPYPYYLIGPWADEGKLIFMPWRADEGAYRMVGLPMAPRP